MLRHTTVASHHRPVRSDLIARPLIGPSGYTLAYTTFEMALWFARTRRNLDSPETSGVLAGGGGLSIDNAAESVLTRILPAGSEIGHELDLVKESVLRRSRIVPEVTRAFHERAHTYRSVQHGASASGGSTAAGLVSRPRGEECVSHRPKFHWTERYNIW
jgi:hypothetical protein